ncbi:MAG: ATP-binding protein [Sporichthyaceae bacterium]|nr:ATP-binding protein [Sporichthyaceae bacterium]
MSRRTEANQEPRGSGWRRFRVRAWLALLATALVTITVGLAGLSQRSYQDLSKARFAVARATDPALVASVRFGEDLARQEADVLGYAQTGRQEAADSYREAAAAASGHAAELDQLVRTPAEITQREEIEAKLAAAREAMRAWQRDYAEPTIETIAAQGAGSVPAATHQAGREQYFQVEAALAELDGTLTEVRAAALDRFDRAANRSENVVVGGLAILLFTLLGVAATMRQTVIRPLALLSKRVRRIARGEYHLPLDIEGALEIRRLVMDVDAMRQRILLELDESTIAREQLDAQALELRRSNAELEQFAYVASHDLREPLRKVASFCQLLERRYGDQLDERGRQYIQFAVDGATRMQGLINDLLAFSRVGRASEGFVEVDAQQSLERIRHLLSATLDDANAEIVTEARLPIVFGDSVLIDQLLQNLLSNAVKFGREGVEPRVKLTARRDGDMWEFTCADNGIGIEPDYAERIFVIFQRLHPRDEYGGTGIGLALCKKIVEYHGGRIWLETNGQPGIGAVFRFTVPAIPPLGLAGNGELGSHSSTESPVPATSARSGG